MQDFEDIINSYKLSEASILERVDEYTLYCKYLGFEPRLRTKYHSITRTGDVDSDPSFSLFISKKGDKEYFWKDNGTGDSGDIFKLIKIKFGYKTSSDVYKRIDFDFKLGFGTGTPPPETKIVLNSAPDVRPEMRIRIQSRDFNQRELLYWASFGITAQTLARYRVKALKYYWTHDFQEAPTAPRNLAFSYEVLGKYKIYQPFTPRVKFRNDLTEKCLEGFAQLQYKSDILIITKSTKDIMLLAEFGYEAVSPRSENTPVPDPFLRYFHKRYKKVLILFDNDMKHRGDMYQEPKIYVPASSGEKDISDFYKAYGKQLTKDLLNTIII